MWNFHVLQYLHYKLFVIFVYFLSTVTAYLDNSSFQNIVTEVIFKLELNILQLLTTG